MTNAEIERLQAVRGGDLSWRTFGPYLAERQWGTVREDYSRDGDAWNYVTHEDARSRAYRWGEDGIAGLSDDRQLLCFSVALWNHRDPFLKERLFGLTGPEGNHGEDVKELYWYLDNVPSHAYMRMLYKYPQCAFPYDLLRRENARRGRAEREFELLDTGAFDDDRYFDVFVEYAKAAPDDILVRIRVENRGPEAAPIEVLPHLWFRNTWSWTKDAPRPRLAATGPDTIGVEHPEMAPMRLACDGALDLLFCANDTNVVKLFGAPASGQWFKDGIDAHVVGGDARSVNPDREGTKAAARWSLVLPAGGSQIVRLRLSANGGRTPFRDFDAIFAERAREADDFYGQLQRDMPAPDARLVQRQALAGMLWSKQFFSYDVARWLRGDPAQPPPPPERKTGRNHEWVHLRNADVISMPDKWEYPWYAAWDLAFHCVALAMVDPDFAKDQLRLMTREWYMHPNGQFPAYEWAFGDVNPPVHAWATWRTYKIDAKLNAGKGDRAFLERVFQKLLLNFTWWVNRKDADGRNIFQGGFLGLDNIGVFDRSKPLPTGGHLEQADATSWMAMYALNMMRIALELAVANPVYQDLATKFFEHFLYIAGAMANIGGEDVSLWDEQDEFFYDVLHVPGGRVPMRVRSMVGLLPLFAVETLEPELLERTPAFKRRLDWFLAYRPDLAALVSRWQERGSGERQLLSLLRGHRMKRLLRRMLDETEFLSPHGVRAISRHHLDRPYTLHADGVEFTVKYLPGESDSALFGGNSNWRGPVWFPMNFMIIESLQKFHHYYGDDFKVECPTGSGTFLTIAEIADELSRRLTRIFLRNERGERPVFGRDARMQQDPHFRDYVLFNEYFNGDDGTGLGASHQTGWTGLVAKLLQPRRPEGSRPLASPPDAIQHEGAPAGSGGVVDLPEVDSLGETGL